MQFSIEIGCCLEDLPRAMNDDRKKESRKSVLSVQFDIDVTNQSIGIMVEVFSIGSGDLGSIPGRVILRRKKWYLMTPYLTLRFIRYRSRVKWSHPEKEVAPFPTPR